MVTTLGVRTHYRMELDLPVLSRAGYYRVVRRVQQGATAQARKRIVTPNRRKMPRETGDLRRSFKARRPRRPKGRDYFTAIDTRFNFYYYFQTREWEQFRQDMETIAADIILEELRDAIQAEGFG